MSIKRGNPSFCVRHWIRIWLMFCFWKTLEKKICSKPVVECDCKLPSLLSLIPMQSSRKCAQNNIATSPGEFQKLGTKRYQSDKLSFEFKIIILEMLILNSRTKSGSAAVLSEHFSLRMHQEHQCLWDGPWAVSSPGAAARPGLSNKVWQSVLGCCCCCCVPTHGQGI